MVSRVLPSVALLVGVVCHRPVGTAPPPDGWANNAPTVVARVVERPDAQLLAVRQGTLEAWVKVPDVGAEVGDFVLLGRGAARYEVEVPELGQMVPAVVDIAHIQIVDEATAGRAVAALVPEDAVPIATVYAELGERADSTIVVYGAVVKATSAVGHIWVHLQDGTGSADAGTHDLTIQTNQRVVRGQRVAFEGTLRADVDLGFGYHYDALVENGRLVTSAP